MHVVGGHSAALNEDNWDSISRFVLDGKIEDPPDHIYDPENQSAWVSIPAIYAPIVWLLPAIVFTALGAMIFPNLTINQWTQTGVFISYLHGVYLAITRP